MFSRILVAIDNIEGSQAVFDRAVSLAKITNACLMLLHVLSTEETDYVDIYKQRINQLQYYPAARDELQNYIQERQKSEEQRLELLRTRTAETTAMGVPTGFTQNIGEPGRNICELARTWQADLIVMGRRGCSGFSEFLLGSVSNYVLHHAPCSVLILQGQVEISSEADQNNQTQTSLFS